MAYLKGQGATEYLVLLAVVLIIALVSIALLGFFPGMASDAKITQSNSYWQGQARPFSIVEIRVNATGGQGTVILQNVEASGTYRLNQINVSSGTNNTQTYFGPGEKKSLLLTGLPTCSSAGGVFDYQVNISYTTPTNLNSLQYGSKNIIGKCI